MRKDAGAHTKTASGANFSVHLVHERPMPNIIASAEQNMTVQCLYLTKSTGENAAE